MSFSASSDAYLIHLRAYRETSALADFYTRREGMVRLVIKGLHGRSKSQRHWKGALRPLQPLKISWRGRSSLCTLVELDSQAALGSQLTGHYLFCAFYINELMQRCIAGSEPDEQLFAAYELCAQRLFAQADMEVTLREFEMALLHALGYGVDWAHDSHAQTIDQHGHYVYDPSAGFTTQLADNKRTVNSCFSGQVLLAIAAGELTTRSARRVAKQVLREALRAHLGSKPLMSRSLFSSRSSEHEV